MAACQTCKGKGICPRCNGQGKTGGIISHICDACRGRKACITCNGSGRG